MAISSLQKYKLADFRYVDGVIHGTKVRDPQVKKLPWRGSKAERELGPEGALEAIIS